MSVLCTAITACVNNTCTNGAPCALNPSDPDKFVCECLVGYSGTNCQGQIDTTSVLFDTVEQTAKVRLILLLFYSVSYIIVSFSFIDELSLFIKLIA
jgi:hypothetical protein